MGKNFTVYISRDTDFSNEPNKSGLLNELYRQHLEKVLGKAEDFAAVGIRSTVKNEVKGDTVISTVTPDPEDIDRFKQRMQQSSKGSCKEGHPIPVGRDRCLGKGCKYS